VRYPKGSIVLSESLDIAALRKIYQGGHVTAWQIYRALNSVYDQSKWKNLLRRLAVLSDRNFLIRLVVGGMNDSIFALGQEGARALQGQLPTVIEAVAEDAQRVNLDQVWHDVELFELHLKLRQTDAVISWTFGYVKDYDAIVTFKCGGRSGRIAIEYERSPKSTKQYQRIAELLDRESRIGSVLYLVCNVQMESFLLNGFRNARRPVYICQAQRFANAPAEAVLVDSSRQAQHRLADCLS
jgi:hypothetical protein